MRIEWFVPNVIDESGFGTGKSLRLWALTNLRAALIEEQACCAYYQTFNAGQRIFWPYYHLRFGSHAWFRAQLGQVDFEGDKDGKANTRGPACYIQHFKNGSQVMMPAPNWLQDAKSQAGLTLNWVVIDEWTKVETMAKKPARPGEPYLAGGINQQILGRLRGRNFNQFHMLWGNHCIFSATAENTNHPSQARVDQFKKEVRRGNPNYAVISFNFKDASNLRSFSGKPFKDEIIDWNAIRNMKTQFTRSHFLRECLGVRVRETAGFYSEAALARCVELGLAHGLQPEIGRSGVPGARGQVSGFSGPDTPHLTPETFYFLGIDPAPAQRKTADEGAMAVLRVRPRPGLGAPPTNNLSDWLPEFVWAYRVTYKNPFTNRQWCGFIHKKHRQFGFAGICMDPQGGGQQIMTELNKTRQLVDGIETEVRPIASLEDTTVGDASFILNLFRGTDAGISVIWPIVQGVDGLYDAAHSTFQQAIEHMECAFPPPQPAEVFRDWPEEKVWAQNNLIAARNQLQAIQVATTEDGRWDLTRHGARRFSALGKKDLAYACLYAWVRFMVWLKMNEQEFSGAEDGETGFYLG